MYRIKKEVSEEIKNKFKQKYIADTLGKSPCYISQLLKRKLACPKTTAYAFTKIIDMEAEILDFFEVA